MDIVQYLTTINLLCSRAFPAKHGRAGVVREGPGFYIVELETSHGLRAGDASERAPAVERFRELMDAIGDGLTESWGPSGHLGLQTVQLRTAVEQIPEPWAHLSQRVGDIYLWEVRENGRWVALGVADRDPTDEIQLLAVVTETDPP